MTTYVEIPEAEDLEALQRQVEKLSKVVKACRDKVLSRDMINPALNPTMKVLLVLSELAMQQDNERCKWKSHLKFEGNSVMTCNGHIAIKASFMEPLLDGLYTAFDIASIKHVSDLDRLAPADKDSVEFPDIDKAFEDQKSTVPRCEPNFKISLNPTYLGYVWQIAQAISDDDGTSSIDFSFYGSRSPISFFVESNEICIEGLIMPISKKKFIQGGHVAGG